MQWPQFAIRSIETLAATKPLLDVNTVVEGKPLIAHLVETAHESAKKQQLRLQAFELLATPEHKFDPNLQLQTSSIARRGAGGTRSLLLHAGVMSATATFFHRLLEAGAQTTLSESEFALLDLERQRLYLEYKQKRGRAKTEQKQLSDLVLHSVRPTDLISKLRVETTAGGKTTVVMTLDTAKLQKDISRLGVDWKVEPWSSTSM